jgi:hypothetical protein
MNQAASQRLPWQDRWQQPTYEQLAASLSDQQRKVFDRLAEGIEQFDGVHWDFAWHGRAWKWTLQFDLYDDQQNLIGPLVYLVPNPDQLEFCMPLKEDTIHQVNLKRLQKFVRDGLRAAKCAVEMHWAFFHPTAVTEADQLLDLVKRVRKVLRGENTNQ